MIGQGLVGSVSGKCDRVGYQIMMRMNPAFPVGEQCKVFMSAHCHNSEPLDVARTKHNKDPNLYMSIFH